MSYLVSTLNRAPYLADALKNVREFITEEDELIIFDGGSTDGAAAVVERNSDIVTVFVSEPDLGEAPAYNKGILASSGQLIKFTTDDDYTFPDAMRRAIALPQTHPDVDALMCGGEAVESDQSAANYKLLRYFWLPSHLNPYTNA